MNNIDTTYPLIDLHRHLDGNVRLQTILELGEQHGIDLPAWDVANLRPYVQVTQPQPGVMAFIAKFEWMVAVLVNYDACRRIAYENVQDAYDEGIDYIELRFSPIFMAETHHLNPIGVVEAVCDGIAAGRRDFSIEVNLIGILSRTYGDQVAWQELEALLSQSDQLVAIDLAGDEIQFPALLFTKHFQRAHDAGLGVIAHAGESTGPESIWAAIHDLRAQRIGHAVTATQDPKLLDLMLDQKIGIECNLTSNVQTSTVSYYASHPIRQFLEHGLLATINTDDPAVSGIDLAYEYNIAAPAVGLSLDQIHQAQYNAYKVAFLSMEQRESLQKRFPRL